MTKFTNLIQEIEHNFLKSQLPNFLIGDLVRIGVSVEEAGKERIQFFDGTVITLHSSGLNTTITIRKVTHGFGVERIIPIHAPCIKTLQILRRSRVSRGKLYFLRNRRGKLTRLKEKFDKIPAPWIDPNIDQKQNSKVSKKKHLLKK
uniref:Large ribosomal subunit protein bL19c n=1 Tax=Prototheca cutis TaxID=575411 RepID=A0A2Z6BES2_9CHLO|nr:50s ribosomal protein l19 [Prototheca cutis]BBD20220.1 50s ribosomal protein l19 [Prototheca cutis]